MAQIPAQVAPVQVAQAPSTPRIPVAANIGEQIFNTTQVLASPVQYPTFRTIFPEGAVQTLKASDFTLDSSDRIALIYRDCILVLFYTENVESRDMTIIWSTAAAQVVRPAFAACNLLLEPRVAEAFGKIQADPNHPLQWAAPRGLPFVLVYRGGWPVAVYNGDRSSTELIDYALNLACNPTYRETEQRFQGYAATNNYVIPTPVINPVTRTTSSQFRGTEPIRNYTLTGVRPVTFTRTDIGQQPATSGFTTLPPGVTIGAAPTGEQQGAIGQTPGVAAGLPVPTGP